LNFSISVYVICTKVENISPAPPQKDTAGSLQRSYNERRNLAQGWFEKASRVYDGVWIPYGSARATFTISLVGLRCSFMDSSRWDANMVENIAERL